MNGFTTSSTGITVNLRGAHLRVERVVSDTGETGRGAPLDCDDDFLVTVQLAPQAEQTLWREGQRIDLPPHAGGVLFIMTMTERWQCARQGPHDTLLIRIGFSAFRALARDLGFAAVHGLATVTGHADPVMAALARAWASAAADGSASPLLLQQLARTIFVHLMATQGMSDPAEPRHRLLSEAQEQAAKAFMRDHAGRNVSVAEIAAAAGLSRGYFSRAFAGTTGVTPFRWLMSYRIQRAKDLLAAGVPIAEIAATCGFSDQSHLNRVFLRGTGLSPAQWRRQSGIGD